MRSTEIKRERFEVDKDPQTDDFRIKLFLPEDLVKDRKDFFNSFKKEFNLWKIARSITLQRECEAAVARILDNLLEKEKTREKENLPE